MRGNGPRSPKATSRRASRAGSATRFVAFGDNSYGDISDRAIAYHTYQQHPDFVMNCGDNVYESGTDDEYQRFFFPVYNADVAGPRLGAPLLRSVPFYTVIANHDVQGKDDNGHEIADFARNPDALAFYTAMHLPLNGPDGAQPIPTPTMGPDERIEAFRSCAGARFPRMANYSFDYGDVHFLCLDSNRYIDPNDAALQRVDRERPRRRPTRRGSSSSSTIRRSTSATSTTRCSTCACSRRCSRRTASTSC